MVIGGGVFQVPCIKAAKEMGVKVVVSDYQPDAPGMLLADHPLVVSTRNINLTVNAAKEFHNSCPLSGVMTVGTDASQTVAAVANALGLPGIPFAVAERFVSIGCAVMFRFRGEVVGIELLGIFSPHGRIAMQHGQKHIEAGVFRYLILTADDRIFIGSYLRQHRRWP